MVNILQMTTSITFSIGYIDWNVIGVGSKDPIGSNSA